MQAFVTGGAGFLGRHLIAALRARGYRVRALAVSPTEIAVVEAAGAEAIPGTLENEASLRQGLAGCQIVFHGAARVDLSADFAALYPVNVEGTRRIVALAREAGARRLVHISASAVITDGRPIRWADESWPVPSRPCGGYPQTKALAERIVLAANTERFTTVAVRPPLLWGLGDQKFLPGLAQVVRQGHFFWIDHGRYLYSRCHVRNACEGTILAAERGRGGAAYFLTDGQPGSFRDFIQPLLRTHGVEPGRRSVPFGLAWMIAAGMEALGPLWPEGTPPLTRTFLALLGRPFTFNDMLARRELGYSAAISWEQGLAELARANPMTATC